MRILVTGAYGLIGSAILARLQRDGHELVGAGRSVDTARLRFPDVRWVALDVGGLTSPQAWRPHLMGIEAVVNAVGVLQDGARDDSRRVHVDGTIALFDACAATGIRIVHISAIGADAAGRTAFARDKAQADAHLRSLDAAWVILRPGLVLGEAAYGGSAMLRAIAAVPFITPVAAADAQIQVVSVDDVAEAVAQSVSSASQSKVTWDVAHPEVHRLRDVVVAMRRWLGLPIQPVVAVPHAVQTIIATVADALGLLGWRSPARSTAFAQLAAGVVGEPLPWMVASGIAPKSLADILRRPSNVQERWFARLFLLKPIAIAGLALFWVFTGLNALGPGRASAYSQLAATGFPAAWVDFTVIVGALFDIVVGLLLCVRRTARVALLVMLAATPGYLLAGTLLAPALWIDPLGPLTKIIPMLIATALTLAILDER